MPSSTPRDAVRLSPNATTVLEKRYLIKDDQGKPVEAPRDLFWRVAATIAEPDRQYGATAAEVEATSFDLTARQESALEEMEARELGTAIERAIARLRPEYRSCIMLRHVEGRSYEEIAATLDLPLGTVKTYIHRARHELREALEHVKGPG